jgi:hypothetical protein
VTTQASSYARFRRALDRSNLVEALSAASELNHVGLVEALELCLLLLDREPAKYERAALRWHSRYCREIAGVDFTEAQAVLAVLAALPGPRKRAAAHSLAELVNHGGFERGAEALIKWAS